MGTRISPVPNRFVDAGKMTMSSELWLKQLGDHATAATSIKKLNGVNYTQNGCVITINYTGDGGTLTLPYAAEFDTYVTQYISGVSKAIVIKAGSKTLTTDLGTITVQGQYLTKL